MKGRKISGLTLLIITGGAGLGAIAHTDLPWLLKEAALLLPLQVAALAYVAWYWRDRRPHPTAKPR
ncbi:MAG TPA: hypothetical protein V6D02_15635 [Candidatus Obscuribacterales bacterium]